MAFASYSSKRYLPSPTMKVCFLLQRNFAYVAHQLAILLRQRSEAIEFCGYVYLRTSFDFLKTQKDIPYTSLILDEDIHNEYLSEKIDPPYLDYLEKEYGLPNLWPYITLDRVVMFNQLVREYPYDTPKYSHEEMIRILQVKARAIIRFLEAEKPEVIVFPNIGGIGALLLYTVAKKKGIKTFIIQPASTQMRYLLSETWERFTGTEELLRKKAISEESLKEARNFLSAFRAKPSTYHRAVTEASKASDRRHQLQFLYPHKAWESFLWFLRLTVNYIRKQRDYSDIHPWYYLLDRIKRKARNLVGTEDLYDAYTPEEDFAFFPLHIDPEIATMLHAPFYTNQTNLMRQIARSLPLHYKLYVKEHPLMVGYRPRSFYKELKKIPNVKLIHHLVSGVEIVSKAKLITVITSSAGWEGALLKKPVISFGEYFYNTLSSVKKCTELERLPYQVKEQLTNSQHDEDELLALLASIFQESVAMDLGFIWEQESDQQRKREALRPLAQLLAKKLNLHDQ